MTPRPGHDPPAGASRGDPEADVDDVLGPGYRARWLPLPGAGPDAAAVLVRRATPTNTRGGVLYVHGYVDYFFQTHLAEHFTDRGYDFYALDLRGYGRALHEDETPYFVTDLRDYAEELDLAWADVRRDGHAQIVLMAHSTGGLIAPLWLADRPEVHPAALVLNSPWLDLQGAAYLRSIGTWAVRLLGPVAPRSVLPVPFGPVYGQSIHADAHGEWAYDLTWKPHDGVPTYLGWLAAIRRAQARLHRGLGLTVPVLVMHSETSTVLEKWSPEAMRSDIVLDVRQIARWGPAIGTDVTDLTVPGGLHDLFLSAPPVRGRVFGALDAWLDARASRPGATPG